MKELIFPILIYIAGIALLLYFFSILPGLKKNRKKRAMLDSILPGDEVTTLGGILGLVTERRGERLRLLIDPESGAKMDVVIYAVQSVKKGTVQTASEYTDGT